MQLKRKKLRQAIATVLKDGPLQLYNDKKYEHFIRIKFVFNGDQIQINNYII